MLRSMGRIVLRQLPLNANGRWVELRTLPEPDLSQDAMRETAASYVGVLDFNSDPPIMDDKWAGREVCAREDLGHLHGHVVVMLRIPPDSESED